MIIRVCCKTLVLGPTTRNGRVGSQSTIHPMLTGRRRARATIALKALAVRIVTKRLYFSHRKLAFMIHSMCHMNRAAVSETKLILELEIALFASTSVKNSAAIVAGVSGHRLHVAVLRRTVDLHLAPPYVERIIFRRLGRMCSVLY
jgi:hypothetical protein